MTGSSFTNRLPAGMSESPGTYRPGLRPEFRRSELAWHRDLGPDLRGRVLTW
jgi:hypothetical protein